MPKSQNELKLERLCSKRETIFRRAQLCYDAGSALEKDPENASKMRNFAVRYSTFEKTLSEYEEIVQDIVILKQEMEPDAGVAYHTHLDAFYDLYSNIEYLASLLINKPAVLSNNPNSTNNSTIKMPKFELVKFDGGFKLTKWMSNSNDLLSTIPEPLQLVKTKQFDKSVSKVLGLQWEEKCDNFSFGLEIPSSTRCTKRNMLSLVARMFDPLGFLSPITLLLKIWIKKLWTLKVDWDSTVPKEIEIAWEKFQNEFHVLYKIQIPRHIAVTPNSSLSFVGFSDASAAGYAAIVYSRVVNCTGQVKVTLLYSQSKVSPMSKITLPRLELCGALLLSKLLSHAIETYSPRHNIDKIFALSDSMIVLNWIKSSEKNLKIFVQNRVVTIHKMVPSEYWFFVPGKENVVDCASRGLFPSSLVNHSTWFTGPNWLLLEPEYWPIQSVNGQEIMICDSEYRSQTFFVGRNF
ncbi:uncharacterized protein LOC126891641 [Diabrotica virgifera virgifera]|uniref:Uncharacterized protein n=1 Tax=Diabrotica virgifera virgifera TaxID=50390 RepID=A0ABM5L322_DIAVI|nr:uncharacterized protein LOC126891641 [Diabrotica virgifera virgifera]